MEALDRLGRVALRSRLLEPVPHRFAFGSGRVLQGLFQFAYPAYQLRRLRPDRQQAPDVPQALLREEHVLRAAQADPFGAVRSCTVCVFRGVRVRPHLQPSDPVRPAEQGVQFRQFIGPWGNRLNVADEYLARRAVEADDVSF